MTFLAVYTILSWLGLCISLIALMPCALLGDRAWRVAVKIMFCMAIQTAIGIFLFKILMK